MLFADPAWRALLDRLRCPLCGAQSHTSRDSSRVLCSSCSHEHPVRNNILHVRVLSEHAEVTQERASVPATEDSPELGGWRERYSDDVDTRSSLARAYLSLPYGNDSEHFREPGYFQNVTRFAAEFDFVTRHLPTSGVLLDVGADGTWSTAQLSRRGLTCIALDITDHLELARLFQTACPPYALVNVDMHEPVFTDDAFDVVTAFNALHHSKRLPALAHNLARSLKTGGVLALIEPYVQNAQQEAAFGAPQSAHGINENVHTLDEWHAAFTAAGLVLERYALSDSFNAVYRKTSGAGSPPPLADFYAAALSAPGQRLDARAGQPFAIPITVESIGRAAWASVEPFHVRLSYHVSRITGDDTTMVTFDNERTLLPKFVGSGHPQTFDVPLVITQPGDYLIEFDLVHETISWFKDRGGRTAAVRVHVR